MKHTMGKVAKRSPDKKGRAVRKMDTGPHEPSDMKRAGSTMDRGRSKRRAKRLANVPL